jgi:6,7-dimethyl-8-ribityllumazine synthase
MFGADKGAFVNAHSLLDGKKLYIGIVQARFNAGITDSLFQACYSELLALGVQAKNITHVTVPGALEVPIALQALAEQNRFDALIALGCIIRGETYHFELVANESGAGVTRISIDNQLPIANAILTVENLEQALARQADKGVDAAKVAVEMANLLNGMA